MLTCIHRIVVLSFPVPEELRYGAQTFRDNWNVLVCDPTAFVGWDWRLGISIGKFTLCNCLWLGGLKSIQLN